MKLTSVFKRFFESEQSAGLILVFCTIFSLMLANSLRAHSYLNMWMLPVAGNSITHWINDGLMAIFFLLIGLELKREIYIGELSQPKHALLPVFAALGGILVPAGIYTLFNWGTPYSAGAGIPMATDIAFSLGILSLLGNKVPPTLKVFLAALAITDDLGAILVIAFFYTGTLSWFYLAASLGIFFLLLLFNKLRVNLFLPYLIGGIAMWYFMLHSGVHATITGVLLAFALPFGNGNKQTLSFKTEKALHFPVSYFILPLFALANTAIPITQDWHTTLTESYSLGIALGLIIGKPLGIILFSYLVTYMGLASFSRGLNFKNLLGIGMLGGIGFTMSIFICLLAFKDPEVINGAKISILLASFIIGLTGFLYLKFTLHTQKK